MLALTLLLAVATPTSAAAGGQRVRAHGSGAGAALNNPFAAALVKQGAGYLVGQLKAGALGRHGATVGNLLGPFVEDGNAAQLAEIRQEIAGLKIAIAEVHASLNNVAGQVVQAQYSQAALEASKITGAIDKAQKELAHLANATTAEQRRIHADHLLHQLGPGGELYSAQEVLHKQLTVPAPHADGLLIAANKAARGKAHPFFTHTHSLAQREVYKYYSIYQAVLLQLRLNYWHAKHYSAAAIQEELNDFDRELAQQHALLKAPVAQDSVVDTRTGLTWTFGHPGKPISGTWTHKDGDVWVRHLPDTTRRILDQCHSLCPAVYGGPWSIPTLAEVQGLISTATGNRWTWLHEHAHFPVAPAHAVTWISPPPHEGTAYVLNLNDGEWYDQPTSAVHFFLLVSDADHQIPGLYYYS